MGALAPDEKTVLESYRATKARRPDILNLMQEVIEVMVSEDKGTQLALEQNIHMFREKVVERADFIRRITNLEQKLNSSSSSPSQSPLHAQHESPPAPVPDYHKKDDLPSKAEGE